MKASDKLRQIVANARGDDLERARLSFGHMTKKELNNEHGQSGRTCRTILTEYEAERADWLAAKLLLDKLLAG